MNEPIEHHDPAKTIRKIDAALQEVYALCEGDRRGKEQEAYGKIAQSFAAVDLQVTSIIMSMTEVVSRGLKELLALQEGSRRWTMRVPVQKQRDSDTVISAALEAAKDFIERNTPDKE